MNYDLANVGGLSMLYGVKVVEPRPAVRLVGNIDGGARSPFDEPFPWEFAIFIGVVMALLGVLFADAAYHVTAMPKTVRVFGATMIGSCLGMALVSFIRDLTAFLKARLR